VVGICPVKVFCVILILSLFGTEKNKGWRTDHRNFRTLPYTSHLAFEYHFFSVGNVVKKKQNKNEGRVRTL